jgi:ParB-like chromosome segregation protein Spo0J
MKAHRYAKIFPPMDEKSYNGFVADILDKGLLHPILTYKGAIVDGRNRERACLDAGVTPRYEPYTGDPDRLLEFIISENLHRRQLTPSQRAAAAMRAGELIEKLHADAKERKKRKPVSAEFQAAKQIHGVGVVETDDSVVSISRQQNSPSESDKLPRTNNQLGEMFGVNNGYVAIAFRVKKEAPELLPLIEAGKLGITAAEKKLNERRDKRQQKEHRAANTTPTKAIPVNPPEPRSMFESLVLYWKAATRDDKQRFLAYVYQDMQAQEQEGVAHESV